MFLTRDKGLNVDLDVLILLEIQRLLYFIFYPTFLIGRKARSLIGMFLLRVRPDPGELSLLSPSSPSASYYWSTNLESF